MRSFRTAIKTLTILPCPGPETIHRHRALFWFPLVGAMFGSILYGGAEALLYVTNEVWTTGVALFVLLLQVLLSGGLHLDGLADWADALGVHSRQRKLDVMNDSAIGSFGMIAIVFGLMAKCFAILQLIELHRLLWVVPVIIISRTGQVLLSQWFPYARETGTAASFFERENGYLLVVAVVEAAVLVSVLSGPFGLLLLVGGLLVGIAFGYAATYEFGGITGDVLGAWTELIEVALLALVSFFIDSFATLNSWNTFLELL